MFTNSCGFSLFGNFWQIGIFKWYRVYGCSDCDHTTSTLTTKIYLEWFHYWCHCSAAHLGEAEGGLVVARHFRHHDWMLLHQRLSCWKTKWLTHQHTKLLVEEEGGVWNMLLFTLSAILDWTPSPTRCGPQLSTPLWRCGSVYWISKGVKMKSRLPWNN